MKAKAERISGFDGGFGGGLLARLRLALQVAAERRRLGELSDRDLSDLGLSRSDAADESRRAVWDLPARRRR